MSKILERSFLARPTIEVARNLIGCEIIREHAIGRMRARIVETEAYTGDDPACHAYRNFLNAKLGKPPKGRSAILFGPPGMAYVYLNYGMHWLFNVVTDVDGTPGAVLIRAVEPIGGIQAMQQLRPSIDDRRNLTNGPGKLSRALGIERDFDGVDLLNSKTRLWLEQPGKSVRNINVTSSPRIGISKAKDRLWRFYETGNAFVSR